VKAKALYSNGNDDGDGNNNNSNNNACYPYAFHYDDGDWSIGDVQCSTVLYGTIVTPLLLHSL